VKYFLDAAMSVVVFAAAGLAARMTFDYAKKLLRRYPDDS
jgi:hypothetical protein